MDGLDVVVARAQRGDGAGEDHGEDAMELGPGTAGEKLEDACAVRVESLRAEGNEIDGEGDDVDEGEEGERFPVAFPRTVFGGKGEEGSEQTGSEIDERSGRDHGDFDPAALIGIGGNDAG